MRTKFCIAIGLLFVFVTIFHSNGQAQGEIDADSDGIPDSMETAPFQVTMPSGAKVTMDLTQQGASSRHKDIFVWVDWMGDDTTPPDTRPHNHRPLDSALRIVQDAFEKAPIQNVDGTEGIRLHFIVSPEPVQHVATLGTGSEDSIWAAFDDIKKAHFPKELTGIFHYCLFAHDITTPGRFGTTGDSRGIPSTDLIVSLGEWSGRSGSEDEQAGTLMHELGHNLGLHHGGLDDTNGKPNYISVMNYLFQTDGFIVPAGARRFDYSRNKLPDLDETNLDETVPLTGDSQLAQIGTRYYCPADIRHPEGAVKEPAAIASSIAREIDWNCDGIFNHNIKSNISDNSPLISLLTYSDWPAISLTAHQNSSTGGIFRTAPSPASNELSLPLSNMISLAPISTLHSHVLNGSVRLDWAPTISSRVVGYEITRQTSSEMQVFSTQETSFIDKLPAGQAASYTVQALYVPHGAPSLVQRTFIKTGSGEAISVGPQDITTPSAQIVDSSVVRNLSNEVHAKIGVATGIASDPGRVQDFGKDVLLQTTPASISIARQ